VIFEEINDSDVELVKFCSDSNFLFKELKAEEAWEEKSDV
jgi:hypothetical protein